VAFHRAVVGGAVFVVGSGDEGLHRFHIHFLDARKLSELQDPVALQLSGNE
jgi:hypothetical protein